MTHKKQSLFLSRCVLGSLFLFPGVVWYDYMRNAKCDLTFHNAIQASNSLKQTKITLSVSSYI